MIILLLMPAWKILIGKNNKIITADFNGDKIEDIMIINENGNKNNIRIFTYENGKLKEIWKERNNRGLIFSGEFLDGFKVNILNKKLNFNKIIDLNQIREDYILKSVYDKSGKLIAESRKISNSGLIQIEPIKLNDRNGIRAIQRIFGIDESDILDEIDIVWKFNDGKWQIVEAKGMKIGNLLYWVTIKSSIAYYKLDFIKGGL